MEDILFWAKRQRENWLKSVELMRAGKFEMFEHRDGARVDITAEAIVDLQTKVVELDDLIKRHETTADDQS